MSRVAQWTWYLPNCDETSLNDKPPSGRPSTATNPENEDKVDDRICHDRRITIRELCFILNAGSNTIETMIEHLGYRKICSKWIPRITPDQHDQRVQLCQELLNLYEAQKNNYF
ncbi:hypothetical protein LAZ67_10002373 [Cordylochernes scorpioides]|uniref:Uncharacterized protein n=1 Tax=Cordylochernes scorpioides TaxID=51811 RepID=A0ABY6KWM6_9ARAC|nr:hypothetical protein LAZ67_10002373 [Cordylochernes scorpioides]